MALTEGSTLTQPDLAGTLARIRQRGGADFFQGQLARTMSEQVSQMGGSLPVDALRAAVPQAGAPDDPRTTMRRPCLCRAGAGCAVPRRWPGWKGQAPTGAAPADSGGFAGLAAVDGKAERPACSLSMGQTFGARAVVPGLGVLLGAPIADAELGQPGDHRQSWQRRVHLRRRRRRSGDGGAGDRCYGLRHHRARPAAWPACWRRVGGQGGWVNAIACPVGPARRRLAACRSAIDPAGAGSGADRPSR